MRMRRRRATIRPRSHTFKKIIYNAGASIAAGTKNDHNIIATVDNITPKQTTNIDVDVPTGSIVTDIYCWVSFANLVSIASFASLTIQQVLANQAGTVNPFTMGGNAQRNQIFYTKFFSLGKDQNVNCMVHFKVPKKYQRMREGTLWRATTNCETIRSEASMMIYKIQS